MLFLLLSFLCVLSLVAIYADPARPIFFMQINDGKRTELDDVAFFFFFRNAAHISEALFLGLEILLRPNLGYRV